MISSIVVVLLIQFMLIVFVYSLTNPLRPNPTHAMVNIIFRSKLQSSNFLQFIHIYFLRSQWLSCTIVYHIILIL